MVKTHFHVVPPLVHSGLQNTSIFDKSYRFGQLVILLLEVETLRLLKINITFSPEGSQKNGIRSWTTGHCPLKYLKTIALTLFESVSHG